MLSYLSHQFITGVQLSEPVLESRQVFASGNSRLATILSIDDFKVGQVGHAADVVEARLFSHEVFEIRYRTNMLKPISLWE